MMVHGALWTIQEGTRMEKIKRIDRQYDHGTIKNVWKRYFRLHAQQE